MAESCFWCCVDAEAAALRHEGPHSTWCPHYRATPLPKGVQRLPDGSLYVASIEDCLGPMPWDLR